jgi:hypothetical protein
MPARTCVMPTDSIVLSLNWSDNRHAGHTRSRFHRKDAAVEMPVCLDPEVPKAHGALIGIEPLMSDSARSH